MIEFYPHKERWWFTSDLTRAKKEYGNKILKIRDYSEIVGHPYILLLVKE